MDCDLCKKKAKIIKKIKYHGKKVSYRTEYLCNNCDMIFSYPKCFEEQNNNDKSDKARYLSDHIYDFIDKIDDEICLNLDSFKYACCDREKLIQLLKNKFTIGDSNTIIISDYLEHCNNIIEEIKNIVKENKDYIFIQVPINDSNYERKGDLFGYFIKNHNYYFSLSNLCFIMNSNGYVLTKYFIDYGENFKLPMIFPCIFTFWRKSNYFKESSYINKENDIINYIKKCERYVEIYNEKLNSILDSKTPIAVWGTSNFCEKLLGMTDLSKKNIIEFYDNDSKKWGTEFFDKKIVEFDKQRLSMNFIKKIFIASNTADKVIYNDLKHKYGICSDKIINLNDFM